MVDEALLTTTGACEGHVSHFSGSFLLSKQGTRLHRVWYRPGYFATDCKKLRAKDGRDVLICQASDAHQGVAGEFLYLIDVVRNDPITPGKMFFNLTDTLNTCTKMPNTDFQYVTGGFTYAGYIENVAFSPAGANGSVDIVVHARAGKAKLPDDVLDKCTLNSNGIDENYKPVIVTRPLTFRFTYDGRTIAPAPDNPAAGTEEDIVPTTSYYVPQPGQPVNTRR
jgi:hypothetical protein